MKKTKQMVQKAQELFRSRLERLATAEGGLTRERYIRYLSMQYHLTQGVQRHFLAVASHSDMSHRRSLRKFLVNFANEEELHFEIAGKDLENLGTAPLPIPLDVELWRAYFDKIVQDRPFIRLGATCVLENLSGGAHDIVKRLFADAKYLNPRNTRFFAIHQHDETLPHGDQIIAALEEARLEPRHFQDLETGANTGWTMYSRLVEWSLAEPAYLIPIAS